MGLGDDRLELPRHDAGVRDVREEQDAEPPPERPSVLWRSVNLRFPDLSELTGPAKAAALQDHIVATAVMRGDLAQLRLEAHIALRDARREWDALLPASGRSKADMDRRRQDMRPDLHAKIEDAKWTIARSTEEMDRHGGTEYESASRTYTLLSGG